MNCWMSNSVVGLSARMLRAFPRQGVELEALDRMHNLRRLAGRGNVIEPTARAGGVFTQHENARGEQIASAEIVEEPAIEVRRLQSGLNLGDAIGRSWVGAHEGRLHKSGERCEDEEKYWFHDLARRRTRPRADGRGDH